jgi:hypothetical protein
MACTTRTPTIDEFVKALERNSYDEVGEVFSRYCARFGNLGPFGDHTRIEISREIRQNGSHGPLPPLPPAGGIAYKPGDVQLLDEATRLGRGPVVVIYCETDEVPEGAWRRLDRYWKD